MFTRKILTSFTFLYTGPWIQNSRAECDRQSARLTGPPLKCVSCTIEVSALQKWKCLRPSEWIIRDQPILEMYLKQLWGLYFRELLPLTDHRSSIVKRPAEEFLCTELASNSRVLWGWGDYECLVPRTGSEDIQFFGSNIIFRCGVPETFLHHSSSLISVI